MVKLGDVLSSSEVNPDSDPVWINGVKKTKTIEYCSSAIVTDGVATFYLTDDGTANGNAVFTTIYSQTTSLRVADPIVNYLFSIPIISEDKKTLTVTVNKLANVILGIIQVASAANGTIVWLRIRGE